MTKHKELMDRLDEILLNLEDMNEAISNLTNTLHITNNYEPKHEKSDEDAVMDIINDIINDLENAHVTIIKKDN